MKQKIFTRKHLKALSATANEKKRGDLSNRAGKSSKGAFQKRGKKNKPTDRKSQEEEGVKVKSEKKT